jgi:glyoxylase-like metal-dependent hydrolase (beta-lactamase superfamily II)
MRVNKTLQTFTTSLGAKIYQIPLEVFPGFWSFSYLVLFDDYLVLIDAGSGIGDCNSQLISGIKEIDSLEHGQTISLKELTHVLITHGHIDHYGGLTLIKPDTKALIGIHELDRKNVTNFKERRTLISHKLNNYLIQSGVPEEDIEDLLDFYRLFKQLFDSVPVDFTYEAIGMHLGPFEFMHVPGHCAGHVIIRLHDVLFCGDHILSDITPHQSPEQITAWTGLGHYLQSLDAMTDWAEKANLALCGHNEIVLDLPNRIEEIKDMHNDRLELVEDFFKSPKTINDLSSSLFTEANGFNALLAIEEAGAHVEYLYQRGNLKIDNFNELEINDRPFTYYYTRQ